MERKQTAYVILGLLAIEPNLSGYEMRRTVKDSVGFFWAESYGQIYPTLRRLAAEGLIAEQPSASDGRRRRRGYSLTPAGRACLEEWLGRPYRNERPRDEFLLKLFFGRDAAPTVVIAHVRRFQEQQRQLLATLADLEKRARATPNVQRPGFPFWMLTLSYGVGQLRAGIEWSESALAALASIETRNENSHN